MRTPGPSQYFNTLAFSSLSRSLMSLPSNDSDAYYYPSNGYDLDDDIPSPPFRGNWGRKMFNEAKWVRKGKMTAWGPSMEDWEVRIFHKSLCTVLTSGLV